MTRLRLLTAAQLERVLFGLDFVKVRQKGSHAFYRVIKRLTTESES